MKSLIFLLFLTGCAGTANYTIHPFYDNNHKTFICCEAVVQNSKDIASVIVHVSKSGDDYIFDFQEVGVGATAPISAQSQSISSVAGAVTSVADAAAKIIK